MNKSSARIKYNMQIQLGLIDIGYSDYVQTIIQNMTNNPITITAGTALTQLLLIKNKIPTYTQEWPHNKPSRGSFGSTGQNFQQIQQPQQTTNQSIPIQPQSNQLEQNQSITNQSIPNQSATNQPTTDQYQTNQTITNQPQQNETDTNQQKQKQTNNEKNNSSTESITNMDFIDTQKLQEYFTSYPPQSQIFDLRKTLHPIHPVLKLENQINPTFITIDLLKIHLPGTPMQRSQEIFSLKAFQTQILQQQSPFKRTNTLPHLQKLTISPAQISQPANPNIYINSTHIPQDASPLLEKTEKNNNPDFTKKDKLYPTDTEISALLAADIADNKKLSADSLIFFQNHDPQIQQIKNNLLGNKTLQSYVLKNNIVCKIFSEKHIGPNKIAIYIPTVLLKPVIIYIHKHFLHPSKTQTFREFASLYFHPRAKQIITQICHACITCAMTKNPENKNIHIGQNRSIKPSKPRQAISIDILYMPTSSKGHTHGLIIADMFSLYLSFFPLKSKSSTAVATALRSYLTLQGIPETIYSDNDPSFLGDVSTLLQSYNIHHATSYPYTQKNNNVEAQVRKVKNAYRAIISDNPISSHKEWHILYPLVIIRINTMISKYGLSRELVHFQNILDNHLPLITTLQDHEIINDHFETLSKQFQTSLAKFLKNKQKSKKYYKTHEKQPFLLHELVMRKHYTPASSLHPTYVGPMRIMDLHEQGALLKDPRTGEIMSVHFSNIRKINIEEFLTLLPSNFDADIITTLKLNRYNKQESPEKEQPPLTTAIEDQPYNPNNLPQKPKTIYKQLRSRKIIQNNNITIPTSLQNQAIKAHWNEEQQYNFKQNKNIISILKPTIRSKPTPFATVYQTFFDEQWNFEKPLNIMTIRPNYKTRYKSSFQSQFPGTLNIDLPFETKKHSSVQFSKLTVHFY